MIRSPTLWCRRSCWELPCSPVTGLRGMPAKSAQRFPCGTNNARRSIVLARNGNLSFIVIVMLNRNLHVPLFCKPLKLFSPLDEQNALRGHQVVKSQRVEFTLGVDPVRSE